MLELELVLATIISTIIISTIAKHRLVNKIRGVQFQVAARCLAPQLAAHLQVNWLLLRNKRIATIAR